MIINELVSVTGPKITADAVLQFRGEFKVEITSKISTIIAVELEKNHTVSLPAEMEKALRKALIDQVYGAIRQRLEQLRVNLVRDCHVSPYKGLLRLIEEIDTGQLDLDLMKDLSEQE